MRRYIKNVVMHASDWWLCANIFDKVGFIIVLIVSIILFV